jgi:hypothetical protein
MKWFSDKGAKDNVSKYFYDVSKIIVGTAVIAPFIGNVYKVKTVVLGFIVSIIFFVLGYLTDKMEI